MDGIYETATENAVAEFQRRYSLPVTGITDRATFDALYLEYLSKTREQRRLYSPDFFPALPESYATEIGERSWFIAALEFVLDELRVVYDTLPPFERNNVFDEDTAKAVEEFQRLHSLPVTGKADRVTWNELGRAYDNYVRYIE